MGWLGQDLPYPGLVRPSSATGLKDFSRPSPFSFGPEIRPGRAHWAYSLNLEQCRADWDDIPMITPGRDGPLLRVQIQNPSSTTIKNKKEDEEEKLPIIF